MVKVSVIIPVYKVPLKYLRACLDSLVAQTMQESEFIVVSDGAPEAECSICEEYTTKDYRLKFFKRSHSGVSATRNYGIEKSQGEYITFVDCDDWIEQETISLVYNYAKQNNSDIVLWEAQTTSNNPHENLFSRNIESIAPTEIHNICKNCIFTNQSKYFSVSLVACKLFRKSLIDLNTIQYPIELQINEDRSFNITAISKAKKISYLNKSLYYYRIHQESTSHKYIPNAFPVLTAFLKQFNQEQNEEYSESIFLEYIRSFFESWKLCYMHPYNKDSIFKRIFQLSNIVKSADFQQQIHAHSLKKFSFDVQIELFLFRFKITFPIYLNAIKSAIRQNLSFKN